MGTNKVTEKIYLDEGKRVKFQLKTANRIASLEAEKLEEDNEEPFKSSIKLAVKDMFTIKMNSKKPLFNEKCQELVIKRKDAKTRFLKCQNTDLREAYREINLKVNKPHITEEGKYINNKLGRAEQILALNNNKNFYRMVKFFQKGYCPNVIGVNDTDRNAVGKSLIHK